MTERHRSPSNAKSKEMNETATTPQNFSLNELLEEKSDQRFKLFSNYVNPQLGKVLRTIGFDRSYTHGEGTYLYDKQGNKYLDMITAFGMFNMGRNHPVVKQAIRDYLDVNDPWKIALGVTPLSGMLAEALLQRVPHLQKAYFASTGTECSEAALKFARATTGRQDIIYFDRGFHGLTYGSLALNGSRHFRDGFGTMMPGAVNVPLNDLERLEQALKNETVAAVMLEPVQGKGVFPASPEFMKGAQELCRRYGTLLVMDEIQTGMGRCGKLFSYQHVPGVEPDMVLLSKSLSGGMVPVGAVLMRDSIYKKVYSSLDRCVVHSSTFGTGGLAMACGLASLHVLENENLIENAATQGNYVMDKLQAMIPQYEMLKEVRGQGLMIGIEFGKPRSLGLKAQWQMIHAADQGLFPQAVAMPLMGEHHIITQASGHNQDIIKLLPALTMTRADADWFLGAFKQTMDDIHRFGGSITKTARHLTKYALTQSH